MDTIFCIIRISMLNIRKWKTDYRIWLLASCIFLLSHLYYQKLTQIAGILEVPTTMWSFPFLYSQFYMKLLYTLPLVFLFCDAPFIDNHYYYVIIRSGEKKWYYAQILYVFLCSAIYYLYLMTLSFALPIMNAEFATDWGKLIYTLARTDVAYLYDGWYIKVSSKIVSYFTPGVALLLTYVLSWLSGTLLGLILFVCNLYFHHKSVGMIVGASLVILTSFLDNDMLFLSNWFSPLSWNTLDQVAINGVSNNPPLWYCMSVFLLLIILSIVLIMKYAKCKNNDKRGDDIK